MKFDNLARSLAMMEDELKRAGERVKIADDKVALINDELASIGENQKQLEVSEEKARKRQSLIKRKPDSDMNVAGASGAGSKLGGVFEKANKKMQEIGFGDHSNPL